MIDIIIHSTYRTQEKYTNTLRGKQNAKVMQMVSKQSKTIITQKHIGKTERNSGKIHNLKRINN